MAFSGGAPAVVSQVLAYIADVASARGTQVTSTAQGLTSSLGSAPRMPPKPDLNDVDIREPGSYSLPRAYEFNLDDFKSEYGDEAAAVLVRLREDYDAFIDTWFGDLNTYVTPAVEWVQRALVEGGTGIKDTVEEQLWARDRARLLKESQRSSEEAMSTWLGRGFSMPPGMLVHQLATIDRDVQDRVGESSRTQAIKSFETEIENVRLSVARAFTLQEQAIAGASKYMLDFLAPFQQGLQVARAGADATSALVASFASYYAQEIAFSQQKFIRDKSNVEVQAQVDQTVYSGELSLVTARAQASAAALQAYSVQAAAALNGLHAQGSVSGVDQTIQNL